MSMFPPPFNEKRDLPIVVRIALREFSPMTEHQRRALERYTGHKIPWDGLSQRHRGCLRDLARSMRFRIIFGHQPPIALITVENRPSRYDHLFNTPRELAAWLLGEYQTRKDAANG